MDAEKLNEMVCDYQSAQKKNQELHQELHDLAYNYLYAADADFRSYSKEEAEMIDSLTVPLMRGSKIVLLQWHLKCGKAKDKPAMVNKPEMVNKVQSIHSKATTRNIMNSYEGKPMKRYLWKRISLKKRNLSRGMAQNFGRLASISG